MGRLFRGAGPRCQSARTDVPTVLRQTTRKPSRARSEAEPRIDGADRGLHSSGAPLVPPCGTPLVAPATGPQPNSIFVHPHPADLARDDAVRVASGDRHETLHRLVAGLVAEAE